MRFRLDTQHYIHDRLLEPGTVMGDDGVPMLNSDGSPLKPSANMTPLDDEAERLWKETFPESRPPKRDPTAAIPLRGTGDSAKSPATVQPPAPQVLKVEPKEAAKPAVTPPAKPVAPGMGNHPAEEKK